MANTKMRVLYDHQAFTMQNYGGISRYIFELIRQFEKSEDVTVKGSILFSNNVFIKNNNVFSSTPFLQFIPSFQKKTELMIALNEFKSKAVLKGNNFDIFHPTYYDTYYVQNKRKQPIVITFYDLIHEKYMSSNHQLLANKKRVLNYADKIIAVSQSAKNDLMEYYKIPDERVDVVHLASSITKLNGQHIEVIEEHYLLYVGTRNNYKNFIFFVEAIAPLLLNESTLFLYCAGGGEFTRDEIKLFHQLKLENKIKWFSGSDESLQKMYTNAIAFIFPSLYEGFGLPMVEAMSCGCPIGASETSSLPEVGTDAALYFNPSDKDSILSVAETLVKNVDVRLTLRNKGFQRAQDFSWQKTATKTRAIYNSLL